MPVVSLHWAVVSIFYFSLMKRALLFSAVAALGLIVSYSSFGKPTQEDKLLAADNAKAKQLYGWQPSYGGREGFKRGLTETAKWFAQHDNLFGYKADIYNI